MPYDITIVAKGAGTKEVEYSVVPARQNSPLTPDEIMAIETEKPIRELQKALNDGNTVLKRSKPQAGGLDIQIDPPDLPA